MERETLQVEFVTPCFLGGASQGAEWRAASIRGELRWWFRAVAGAEHGLEEVRKAEAAIFGSTERQARLRIRALGGPGARSTWSDFDRRLRASQIAQHWNDTAQSTVERLRLMKDGKEILSNPLHYLGFGPFEKGNLARPYLPAGNTADFHLDWRPGSIRPEFHTLFEDALWSWLNLGGLGAKSRKGYGSLKLLHRTSEPSQEPPSKEPTDTREAFQSRAREVLQRARDFKGEPEWTHFSARSRVFLAKSNDWTTWQDAMERLGSWIIAYRRRYGSSKDVRVVDGLPLKNRDYDWAAPNGKNLGAEIPDRTGFGLPLPFKRKVGDRHLGESVTWSPDGESGGGDTRRASPLLLHVARFGRSYAPVLTYLPARFIPGKLKFDDHADLFDPTPRQLAIIDEFLDDLKSKNLIQEVTP